jgi:hypothetical protein
MRQRYIAVRRRVPKLPPIGGIESFVLEETVQERGMRGVDPDFQCLQPVAFEMALEGERVRLGRDETVELGKRGACPSPI